LCGFDLELPDAERTQRGVVFDEIAYGNDQRDAACRVRAVRAGLLLRLR
jgi:hypothetical protein